MKINTLSELGKKGLNKRIKSSIFIFVYTALYFILAIFCDKVYNWSPFLDNDLIKQVIGFILLFSLLPLVVMASKEISFNFFKNNKVTWFVTSLILILTVYAPTISYFIYQYKIIANNIDDYFIATKIFITLLFCTNVIGIISFMFMLAFNQKLNISNFFTVALIYIFINSFFVGTFYITFTRGWITYLLIFLIVILSDTFAYVGGTFFGKTKLAPKTSPNKTVEGLLFGLFVSTFIIMIIILGLSFIKNESLNKNHNILYNVFGFNFSSQKENFNWNINHPLWWISVIVIFLVLSLISTLGDLIFSFFKRKNNIKDYSNLIPGHGGLLDRIDSQSVVVFVMFSFILIVNSALSDEFILPLMTN